MQKVSVKKLSILGIVLMAASAVTAAIIPSKPDENVRFAAGSLTQNSAPGGGIVSSWTCELDTTPGSINNLCNVSATDTTEGVVSNGTVDLDNTTDVGNDEVVD